MRSPAGDKGGSYFICAADFTAERFHPAGISFTFAPAAYDIYAPTDRCKISWSRQISKSSFVGTVYHAPWEAKQSSAPPPGHVMGESEGAGQTIPDGNYWIFSALADTGYLWQGGTVKATPHKASGADAQSDFSCNMAKNLQADCVPSRQAGFLRCCLRFRRQIGTV